MKAGEFADLIITHGRTLKKSFDTTGDTEKAIQVELDSIIKGRFGVSTKHVLFGGFKFRENPYIGLLDQTEVVDFSFINNRNDKKKPSQMKRTVYFIEIKAESGGNIGRFSGDTWYTAMNNDIEKLKPVANWILYAGFAEEARDMGRTKSRCFSVVISFFPQTSAKIASEHMTKVPGSEMRRAWIDECEICAVVFEVKPGADLRPTASGVYLDDMTE